MSWQASATATQLDALALSAKLRFIASLISTSLVANLCHADHLGWQKPIASWTEVKDSNGQMTGYPIFLINGFLPCEFGPRGPS
ncbi:MAG: hypothetical protein WAM72_00945 [Xanthobacteraceae bacterium]